MKDIYAQIDTLQKEINSHRPLNNHLLKQIKEYYRIGLTYTSNAIEGNSLTEAETKIVLEEGITIGGKRLIDHLEAVGHSDAFDCLYELAQSSIISEEDIKLLHKIFYYRIDSCNAGVYRQVKTYITGSKYPLPEPKAIPQLMEQLVALISTIGKEKHPVEVAAIAHKELVFIHPFIDGNGRVARLLMNLLLLQHRYTIAVIPPIIRPAYIQALEKAHTNDRDFLHLIAQMVLETQKDYLRLFLTQ